MGRDRKDAGGEEVPCLPAFLNIIPCYPELTQAKEIMVKGQPGKNWRMRFSETDLLGLLLQMADTQVIPLCPQAILTGMLQTDL